MQHVHLTAPLRRLLAGATLAALTCSLPALAAEPGLYGEKDLQVAAWLRDAARSDNKSYAILESLTTEVGPRMGGTPGDAKAVAWAEAKFRELGFDKVWKEPVTFPAWKRGVETARITAPFEQPLVITALGNSIATPAGGLSAEVVQFATLEDLQNADAATVNGKIVFINRKMSAHRDGRDYGPNANVRSRGAVEAAKKGALAIVIRSVGTDSHRVPHTGNMNYEAGVTKIPAAAMSIPDAELLANIFKRGKPVTMTLDIGAAPSGDYTSYNVIGEITGSEKPDEHVLIGGHLDSWDLGTGAVDDGAGCAITMAAAEFIKRSGLKPRRSIRVVLWANEEQGLWGGNQYGEAHKHEAAKVIAAAEADFGQGPIYRLSSRVRPEGLAVVRQMQDVMAPLGIEPGDNNAGPGPDLWGIAPYGVALFGLAMDGSDYFHLHHTPDDTFDKIEPARINQAAAAYTVFAWMAANSPVSFGSGHESLKIKRTR